MKALYEMLLATYAAVNQDMPDVALKLIAADLAPYPIEDVAKALTKCRRECRRITLVDILSRIPGSHPSPEEAWAICAPALTNERITVVWTRPMAIAFGAALNLQDDKIAARMAFKEVYAKELGEAMLVDPQPKWVLSPGYDANQRAEAVQLAVKEGKLLPDYAEQFLITHQTGNAIVPALKKP